MNNTQRMAIWLEKVKQELAGLTDEMVDALVRDGYEPQLAWKRPQCIANTSEALYNAGGPERRLDVEYAKATEGR